MAVTCADLIANVRSRANIEHTQHVTDAEIVTWLNDEGDEFYQKLVSAREHHVVTFTTFTLTSGTNTATLPADFLKPISIALPRGGSVPPFEILPLDSIQNRSTCERWRYDIMGQKIYIWPNVNVGVGPYEFFYVPKWVTITSSPDVGLIPEMERFAEIIALGAASMAKVKRKMLDDAKALRDKQNAMTQSGIESIPGRKGSPKQIPMPLKDRERYYGRGRLIYRT